MKKIVFKLLLFFVIFVVADTIFGHCFFYMMSRSQPSSMKNMYNLYSGDTSDVVIMGSSRAMHHYDPRILRDSLGVSCMNYGAMSNGIVLMYGRYKMLTKNHNPKLIIYDIHPPFDLTKEDNTKYLTQLRPFAKDKDIFSYITRIDSTESLKLKSNLYRFNSMLGELLSTLFKIDYNLFYGYAPLIGNMKVVTPDRLVEDVISDIDTLKLRLFEEMIIDCKNRNIKLCFFVSPAYNRHFSKSAEPILKLLKEHDVPFYCFDDKRHFPYNPNYFYDSYHLNDKGVAIYTNMIVPVLKDFLFNN